MLNITHGSARIYQDDPVATTTPLRTSPVHPGEPTVQHGSTRFWTSSRFTPVVFDMSKTAGAAHGSSRNIPNHPGPPGITTVRPPVHPGSPRFMNRDEPGAMWDCCLAKYNCKAFFFYIAVLPTCVTKLYTCVTVC